MTDTTTDTRTTALYRYFDGQEVLLYVGITADLAARDNSHIKHSRWMQLTVRSSVERYANRREALDAERAAIETEQPIFNRQHNDGPEAIERLEKYLAEHALPELLPTPRAGLEPPPPLVTAEDAAAEAAAARELMMGPRPERPVPLPLPLPRTCDLLVSQSAEESAECGRNAVTRLGVEWVCLAHLGEAALKFDQVTARMRRLEAEQLDRVIAQAEAEDAALSR